MHYIEPHYSWHSLYTASEDVRSPFYGRKYSEFECSNTLYNFYIHPQWDEFGSTTLYIKILYVDYELAFTIIEMLGEWNDCINNDIMFFKREIIESLLQYGIKKYILIGENVLNFHASDDCYYEEWFSDVEEGWIAGINFREHVLTEFSKNSIDYYLAFGGELNTMSWRTFNPVQLFEKVNEIIRRRLME